MLCERSHLSGVLCGLTILKRAIPTLSRRILALRPLAWLYNFGYSVGRVFAHTPTCFAENKFRRPPAPSASCASRADLSRRCRWRGALRIMAEPQSSPSRALACSVAGRPSKRAIALLRHAQLRNSTAAVCRLYIAPKILMVPLLSRSASTALFFRMLFTVIWTFVRATASMKA
jgi:hypothetical protein